MRIPFLYTFFFFFLALLIISFLILPTSQELISQRKKLLDLKADLRNQESYFLQIKNTAAELKKYEEALSKIDSALPSTPNLPELFNFVQKISAQNKLSLKKIGTISTAPITLEGHQFKEAKINFTLEGNYQDFKNFLSLLENSARLIEVENVTFAFPEKEKLPFEFFLTIKVKSY